MIQPDENGMVPCACGAEKHFAKPCAACAGPNPAVLPAPGLRAGATPDARAEADAARSGGTLPGFRRTRLDVLERPPGGAPGFGEWGGGS